MTPFEEAVAAGGLLVAAWDLEDNERMRLALYSTGPGGAKRLAQTDVPSATHEAMVDRLVDRGVRMGACYAGTPFVWSADERGFAVWDDKALTASGKIASRAVAAVQVFLDPADRGHRGVRLKLKTGGTELIAEERSLAAHLDITYGQDNLYYDTFWAQYLGEHLAVWHCVPLENDIQPTSIEADLAIVSAARDLAGELEKQSVRGEVTKVIGPVGRSTELAFVFEPDASDAAVGTLAIRVKSQSGKTTSTKVIKPGSIANISAFLWRVTTPAAVQWTMNELIRQQNREESR